MSVPALDALAAAEAAGVKIILNGGALVLEARPKLPSEVVAQLKTWPWRPLDPLGREATQA
jgi:hypothetical protein